ncbi:hypothetical protein [Lactococcus kimchii]|uniref:hypothetical protein n=1 Tax=Lactococcus sp. S-13 TaxID=2507158 RepID=UPI00102387DA|nr:hypothetical protein [Lactococcus sp. S-13]RZI48435.1 hypothetical protein EQJ87_02635 [Lactococcus sp. S-13]RZI48793.1 hypothetical protein EQJ87_04705 [Lactococcus sp. S-13]RZI49838.1 hypothetical protein EQJ87_10605 [Lactococcus sp. S-13]
MEQNGANSKYYTDPKIISSVLIMRNVERKTVREIAKLASLSQTTVTKIINDYSLTESFAEIVQKYLADNMGEAAAGILDLARHGENERVRLDAWKMILGLGGVTIVEKQEVTSTINISQRSQEIQERIKERLKNG